MIYEKIENEVEAILSADFTLIPGVQILTEFQTPEEDIDQFVRQVWTYGYTSDISNKCDQETPILNLEIYQRKNIEKNILDLVREIKYTLKRKLNVKCEDNEYIKINQIMVNKNTNDLDFNSFTLSISFSYLYER